MPLTEEEQAALVTPDMMKYARTLAWKKWKHDEAEAAAYEGLAEAARLYDPEEATSSFKTFATTIVSRRVIDQMRLWYKWRKRSKTARPIVLHLDRHMQTDDGTEEFYGLFPVEETGYQEVESADVEAWTAYELTARLQKLSITDRRIIAARMRGETLREAGARCGVTESRASQIVKRTREHTMGSLYRGLRDVA